MSAKTVKISFPLCLLLMCFLCGCPEDLIHNNPIPPAPSYAQFYRPVQSKKLGHGGKIWKLSYWHEVYKLTNDTTGQIEHFDSTHYDGGDLYIKVQEEEVIRQNFVRWHKFYTVADTFRGNSIGSISKEDCQPVYDGHFNSLEVGNEWAWRNDPEPKLALTPPKNPYSIREVWYLTSLTSDQMVLHRVSRYFDMMFFQDSLGPGRGNNLEFLREKVGGPGYRLEYDCTVIFDRIDEVPPCAGECSDHIVCQNGGTFDEILCECQCPPDYTGPDCSEIAVGCINAPLCVNGELVREPGTTECYCECEAGWFGESCDQTDVSVSTEAGGFSGCEDGQDILARFTNPAGIDADAFGNIYIADQENHKIRKMDPDGMVTTLAGGSFGFQDGPGSAAQFGYPRDVAIDQEGNIYVADFYNHAIRIVHPDLTVSTLAGNGTYGILADGMQASSDVPTFAYPTGVALDPAEEYLYITDLSHRVIRLRLSEDPAEQTFLVIAGQPLTQGFADGTVADSRFNEPWDLIVDENDYIYVADKRNNAIRIINQEDQLVSTMVGSPPGLNPINIPANIPIFRPEGLAFSPDGSGIYYADSGFNRIRKAHNQSGFIIDLVIAGDANSGLSGSEDGLGADARFNHPVGMVLGPQGNIWVADQENHLIRKIDI